MNLCHVIRDDLLAEVRCGLKRVNRAHHNDRPRSSTQTRGRELTFSKFLPRVPCPASAAETHCSYSSRALGWNGRTRHQCVVRVLVPRHRWTLKDLCRHQRRFVDQCSSGPTVCPSLDGFINSSHAWMLETGSDHCLGEPCHLHPCPRVFFCYGNVLILCDFSSPRPLFDR